MKKYHRNIFFLAFFQFLSYIMCTGFVDTVKDARKADRYVGETGVPTQSLFLYCIIFLDSVDAVNLATAGIRTYQV